MYKLVIADDETYVLEGLSKNIDWASLGFEIAAVFMDGADVLEYINSMPVDVVLTDVRMKHISGIEIAKFIKSEMIPCKVVFISGFKEFDLVHQALKYGVEDYILKPSKTEELHSVFERIRNRLDEDKRTQAFYTMSEKRWIEIQPILEEKFLNETDFGILNNETDIRQRALLLYPEIDVENDPCMIARLSIENFDEYICTHWNSCTEHFYETLAEFLSDGENINRIISKSEGNIRIFMILKRQTCDANSDQELWENACEAFLNRLQSCLQLQARLVPEHTFPSILKTAGWRTPSESSLTDVQNIGLLLKEREKMIITNIMLGNISTSQKIFRSTLISFEFVIFHSENNFVLDTLTNIRSFLQENNSTLYAQIQPYFDYHVILSLESPNQLLAYCDRIFDLMKSKQSLPSHFDRQSIVNKIKEYVEAHIFEDISLENVADALFISGVHLNRILKKQLGVTFLQFATRLKMEKAAELLHDSQYKVYQIGEIMGYKTHRYFSKLFYNYCGYYPSQYRKEVLKLGENDGEEDEV